MHRLKTALLFSIVFIPVVALAEDIHPDVQAALEWQLPVNKCEFKLRRSNVTSGIERKYKKAIKKYKKCVATYMIGLATAQKKMMSVAGHGLTQKQADTIMGHMKDIQSVIQTRGLRPAAPAADVPLDTKEIQQTQHH